MATIDPGTPKKKKLMPCGYCQGEGVVNKRDPGDRNYYVTEPCPKCGGSGHRKKARSVW